jgi:nucleotide-binding universal stress UspA family protein
VKTIIVPTDFSRSSVNAVYYAAYMAEKVNATLILLNAVQVPMFASEIPVPEPVFEEMVSTAKHDLEDLKDKLMIQTNGKLNISTEANLGAVADLINEISDRNSPFAIVMGLHAGKSMERLFMGSKTFNTLKHNAYPILIIPENAKFRAINKIGLACDLEAVIETIPFGILRDWLSVFNASLEIIHVSENDKDPKLADVSESISLQNHLSKFHPKFKFLSGRNLAERLSEYTKEQNLDLLVVIPKKHGFLGMFDKKYSQEIIVREQIPILAIHI